MKKILLTFLSYILLFPTFSQQQGDHRPPSVFNTTVPAHLFDIILARPTENSITLSLLFYKNTAVKIEYWQTNENKKHAVLANCVADKPECVVLCDLKPDAKYYYTLRTSSGDLLTAEPYHFFTAKKSITPFTFTITADSHLDENADTEVYKTTLLNAAGDSADFHFDLGDTFMTDKYRENYRNALNQYIAQRFYLGLLCKSAPLFFVQGNHDGEAGQRLNGTENNMTVWSNLTRKTYFSNPVPDRFYTGNTDENAFCGKIQNYYAFQWGNALFVVLDPFWYTPRSGMDNPWDRTLGKQQYDWLKSTLENSKAAFKFVFIHNLVGGADLKGKARGGSEVAGLYEWGGKNSDGTEGFKSHRPDWEMPIHQMLIKNNVTVVFHGHDHIFAKQDLEGIVYQCVPQPGAFKTGNLRYAEEYGYKSGKIENKSGYLRIKIMNNDIITEYVGTNGNKVIDAYEIKKH